METIPRTPILDFNANTLDDVRKQFNLDNLKVMNESIDIIEAWLQKQDHLVKKKYPRSQLERAIILNKGSVEKTKSKLEKICTFRWMYPDYFGIIKPEDRRIYPDIADGLLPQMTPNHERIYVLKNTGKKFEYGFFNLMRYMIAISEYLQAHDYNNGIIILIDYTDVDIYELIKALNIVDWMNAVAIVTDGYGMRLKGLHILSQNKAIDIVVKTLNKIMSSKLAARIMVHKNVDTLYEYIPKDILPKEYEGKEKSMDEISENNLKEITSETFNKYLKEMSEAVTNEKYRQKDQNNTDNDMCGVPGTFRNINID